MENMNVQVVVRKQWAQDGNLGQVVVSVWNMEQGIAFPIRHFPVDDPAQDDVVYQEAWRWGYRLAGVLEVDYREAK